MLVLAKIAHPSELCHTPQCNKDAVLRHRRAPGGLEGCASASTAWKIYHLQNRISMESKNYIVYHVLGMMVTGLHSNSQRYSSGIVSTTIMHGNNSSYFGL